MSSSLYALRPFIDAGRRSFRNRAIGAYVAAAVVLAITIAVAGAHFYASGPIVLVVILALVGAGFHRWYWTLDWSRHPVLVALVSAPHDVVSASVLAVHGRAALLDTRSVELRTAKHATMMIEVHRDMLGPLGGALRDHCGAIRLDRFPSE